MASAGKSGLTMRRLARELKALQANPPPGILARPESATNPFRVHFCVDGPADTDYAGGKYHGVIMIPPQYPMKPPGVKLFTPSGRFEPGVRICMSNTDYHSESWNPTWNLQTMILAFQSMFPVDEPGIGAIRRSSESRKQLAKQSLAFNVSQSPQKSIFCSLFPEMVAEAEAAMEAERAAVRASQSGPASGAGADDAPGELTGLLDGGMEGGGSPRAGQQAGEEEGGGGVFGRCCGSTARAAVAALVVGAGMVVLFASAVGA